MTLEPHLLLVLPTVLTVLQAKLRFLASLAPTVLQAQLLQPQVKIPAHNVSLGHTLQIQAHLSVFPALLDLFRSQMRANALLVHHSVLLAFVTVKEVVFCVRFLSSRIL